MKFYQKIAPVMFSVVYTATIFGMETTKIFVPTQIFDLVDQFRENHYEETGHIETKDGEKEIRRVIEISCSLDILDFDYRYFDNRVVQGNYNDNPLVLSTMKKIESQSEADLKKRKKALRKRFCDKNSSLLYLHFKTEYGKIHAFSDSLMIFDNYMCTLEAPKNITSLENIVCVGVDNNKTIVTRSKEGHSRE